MGMIIKKVRQAKLTKQKEITIPKDSEISSGDYVAVFLLDKKMILELDDNVKTISLREILK